MKILMTGFPSMGGSGMIATRLGVELAQRGHDVHFLFYKRPFFLYDDDRHDNITFHEVEQPDYALFKDIGSPYTIQAASKIAEIVKKHEIQILHSHYAIPHAVSSYIASKMVKLKTIVTTHGSDAHTLGILPSYNATISHALKNTNVVTSVSKYLAQETESIFDLNHNSVPVIHDFVNSDLFVPKYEERELTLVQASNFRPVKQVPILVEIFAKVATDHPEWKLKLVGDGPDVTLSLRTARKFGIRPQVEFIGVQKDIPNIFAKASIIVSSSKMESFGLTLAEGMSCETPIWAPNVGGIPELCVDGVTGYLYDLDDKNEAASKLSDMMENESKRKNMGKAARNRILGNFTVEKIVHKYELLYQDLLDHRIDKIQAPQK